jgi:hypothetical protein
MLLAMLLSINLLACALDSAPQIADTTQAIEGPPDGPLAWDPSRNGAEDICAGAPDAVAAEVTIQSDPEHADGSTVLAVVRCDGPVTSTYQVRAGADEAAFRSAVTDAHATLTVTTGQYGATTRTGSAAGGPIHPPHPNV